jgi:predicted ArsR family transcriptional regulator
MQGTRRRILELLRLRGGLTIPELGRLLRLTRTAVVNHLHALLAEGLVAQGGVRPGRRRPSALFVATPAADAVFPKTYREFGALFMEALKREDATVFARVLARLRTEWLRQDLPAVQDLQGRPRLEAVRRILAERGFLPSLEWDARGYTLREHNCPLMALAAAHPEICTTVHGWLEALAGHPLTRVRCMSQGDPVSEYVTRTAPIPMR